MYREVKLELFFKCYFFSLFLKASRGKSLKEEWISYICHEVLNVSSPEHLLQGICDVTHDTSYFQV